MRSVLMRLDMKPRWGRIGRVAGAAVGMGVAVALARYAGLPLGTLAGLAVAVYIGLLFALRALTPAELSGLLRRDPVT
jgi:hypothetical protein